MDPEAKRRVWGECHFLSETGTGLVRARKQIVRANPVPWSLLPGPENCSGMRRLEPLGVPRPGVQSTVPQSLLEFTGLGGAETLGISWLVWLRAFVDNGVDFLDARP